MRAAISVHCSAKPTAATSVTRQPPALATTITTKQSLFARRAAAATAAVLVLAVSPPALLLLPPPPPALAASAEKVADFAASGILFRDSVEVTALDDPDVSGATVFVADFKRSLTAKLAKDFFSEPSQASISCAADPTSPLRVVNAARVRAAGGTELFSERKGLSLVESVVAVARCVLLLSIPLVDAKR